jgi:hypothetical protein
MRRGFLCLTAACAASSLSAASPPGKRTYANPIDIDYRYNWEQINQGVSYRTGADPAVVRHNGAYYLFQTLADGYWRSTNLVDWTFVTPSRWPADGVVAPALFSDGDRLIMMPSMSFNRPGSIYVSTAPETGKLDYLVRRMPDLPGGVDKPPEEMKPGEVPPGPWDPGLFKDDDGQWYLYWGSSNVFPIYGQKIAFEDGKLIYQTKAKPLFVLHPDQHGWERFGRDHSGLLANGSPTKPYVEGAWVTKHGGKYYLQYGAPGTEFNVYANGTYVSDHPLGPFEYAAYNPVAYKPGGFVVGAGHGSTFEDAYGNYWNTGTPWIGYNWTFERRIAMFPTRFYADGQMASNTRFGDYPHYVPDRKIDDLNGLFTGWMLLSYKKAVVASSARESFPASAVTDENYRTNWVAAQNRAGETLTVDLGSAKTVRAVQVDFGDYQSGRFGDAPDIYSEFTVQASADGRNWSTIAQTEPPRRDRPNAYFELASPVRARFVRYVHGHVGAANLAIAELRVFGTGDGPPPRRTAVTRAMRQLDDRNADIAWRAVPGAQGYNVRFGIRPDRLHLTYQKYADQLPDPARPTIELRSLNKGVPYYVAVEAFNETGVSPLSKVQRIR